MRSKIIALVVAAGKGKRLGGAVPKQYQQLGNKPMLQHSLDILCSHPHISSVRAVINQEHTSLYNDRVVARDALLGPVYGGVERSDSVRLGLESLEEYSPGFVLIHDAARPFVSHGVIDRVIEALESGNASVIPAVAVKDTLKRVAGGAVIDTIERVDMVHTQTPQGFDYKTIMGLHDNYDGSFPITDDAMLAEHAGIPVHIVAGEEMNNKITTNDDMVLAQYRVTSTYETRCGSGYDIHRLVAYANDVPDSEQVIKLCGVSIPHGKFLEGHSDADVALHALVDAILGAIGEGDIGVHFPPSDPKWKGADSRDFVEHACQLLHKHGGELVNVDITLQAEKPKLSTHYATMRKAVAEMLDISHKRVSVKSTTAEKMGNIGREEAIAAQVLVTVRIPETNYGEE